MANNTVYQPHKSSLGDLNANLVMLIAYLGSAVLAFIPFICYIAFLVPIVVFFIEKNSPYVRFHAVQAVLVSIVETIIGIFFSIITSILSASAAVLFFMNFVIIGVGLLALLVNIALLVIEIICIVKSWKYECFKLPLVGNLAEKVVNAK